MQADCLVATRESFL